MLIEKLRDQWICSRGNWVDRQLSWCPDCCEQRATNIHETEKDNEVARLHTP